jgi:hemoglobin-like flavoprotein
MTPNQIDLVRSSFARIAPAAGQVAALFYGRLFEIDPPLRRLFRGDMTEQGRKLMQVLATAVAGLDRLGELAPVLHGLGRRHAAYGVADAHYDTVAQALLWTLEQGLDVEFTLDVREAWTVAYGVLAQTMREGASAPLPLAA